MANSNSNSNSKNEMDALYHAVKDMSEMQLRLMRIYAQHLKEMEMETNSPLLNQGNFLVQGSAYVH